jgi:hypothetical protein
LEGVNFVSHVLHDITVTTAEQTFEFKDVAFRRINIVAPGMPMLMELTSALNTSIALIVLHPGMVIAYHNQRPLIVPPSGVDVLGAAILDFGAVGALEPSDADDE